VTGRTGQRRRRSRGVRRGAVRLLLCRASGRGLLACTGDDDDGKRLKRLQTSALCTR
jgi:hypothetical protein